VTIGLSIGDSIGEVEAGPGEGPGGEWLAEGR
jgi:hypothetical protein